jgi:hypothetical protein
LEHIGAKGGTTTIGVAVGGNSGMLKLIEMLPLDAPCHDRGHENTNVHVAQHTSCYSSSVVGSGMLDAQQYWSMPDTPPGVAGRMCESS